MPSAKSHKNRVKVRCFCGHCLSISKNARRQVMCSQCHLPLPMEAIRTAIQAREREKLAVPT